MTDVSPLADDPNLQLFTPPPPLPWHRPSVREILVTLALLAYVAGVAMFYLHAIYRMERGAPIADVWHWLVDSSLGFIALSPALFLIMPWVAKRFYKHPVLIPLVTGILFAICTTPGPIFHGIFASEGGFVATTATRVFGPDPGVIARGMQHLEAVEDSEIIECVLQLLVGLPVYVLIMYVAYAVNRGITLTSLAAHTGVRHVTVVLPRGRRR
jgi:hypothetical protein